LLVDDFFETIVEFLYETVGPRRATAVLAVVAAAAAAGLTFWHVHLGHLLDRCAALGPLGQLVDPNAPNCGLDKNLHLFVLVAVIIAWLVCAGFAVAFVVLVANPSLFPEEDHRGLGSGRVAATRGRSGRSLGAALTTTPQGDVLVAKVMPGRLADQLGLEAGDRIMMIDGSPYSGLKEFCSRLDATDPGEPLDFTVRRRSAVVDVSGLEKPERRMTPFELIAISFETGSSLVRDERWEMLTARAIRSVGAEIQCRIGPGDEPGVLMVAHPEILGASSVPRGVLLVLRGKVILAWRMGLFGRQVVSRVLTVGSSKEITELGRVPSAGGKLENVRLRLPGVPSMIVHVPNFGNAKALLFALQGVMDGAIAIDLNDM
jgi:hypothetical protein